MFNYNFECVDDMCFIILIQVTWGHTKELKKKKRTCM